MEAPCICTSVMLFGHVGMWYGPNINEQTSLACDGCGMMMIVTTRFYHCPNEDYDHPTQHKNYDCCFSCAYERWSKKRRPSVIGKNKSKSIELQDAIRTQNRCALPHITKRERSPPLPSHIE